MLIILDRQQNTIGAANNVSPNALPYFDDWHEETVDGIDTYKFIIPADHPDSGLIEVRGHIIFTDAYGDNRLFTVKELTDTYYDFNKPAKEVFCESTAISELLGYVVRPQTIQSADARMAITTILQNASAGWEVGFIEDTYSTDIKIEDYMSVMEALRFLADEQYFKDLYFTVELRGTEIVKKLVNLKEDRGVNEGVRFDYRIDLLGAGRTEDTSELATALIGLGKADSKGNRVTLQSLAAFDDGDFYKLDGTDWIGSDSALQQFGIQGRHIFGIHIDDQADTVEKLKDSTLKALERRSVPLLYYSASVENLAVMTDGYDAKQIRLGDWVTISDWTFDPPIVIEGKVMKLERSYLDPTQDKVDLGRYKKLEISVPAFVQKLQDKINQNEEKWNIGSENYEVFIESTGGFFFKNGTGSTTLKARLFRGGIEVDPIGSDYDYTWKMYDKDGNQVTSFGTGGTKTGKTISVTATEVNVKSSFIVEVNEKEGS